MNHTSSSLSHHYKSRFREEELLPGNSSRFVEDFKAGESLALAQVYQFYAPRIARFLKRGFNVYAKGKTIRYRGVAQITDVEDVVQETFFRAFAPHIRRRYDGKRPYGSYLRVIAQNLILSDFRRREVSLSVLNPPISDEADFFQRYLNDDAAHSDLEHDCDQRTTLARYRTFKTTLSLRDRRYLEARYEDEQSQTVAGKQVNLSLMQARLVEKKLMKRIKAVMQNAF